MSYAPAPVSSLQPMAMPVPEGLLGPYRLLRTLAFGGMAQIFLAQQVATGRHVVIKKILPHYAVDPEFVQFFIHEGRLGQRLRHPNLVETLEAGQVGSACYIALEYLRGFGQDLHMVLMSGGATVKRGPTAAPAAAAR